MANGQNIKWKVSNAEFFGYMRAKMEDHTNQIKEVKNTLVDFKKSNSQSHEKINKRIDDVSQRVDGVEKDVARAKGFAAAIGAGAGFIMSWIKDFFGG